VEFEGFEDGGVKILESRDQNPESRNQRQKKKTEDWWRRLWGVAVSARAGVSGKKSAVSAAGLFRFIGTAAGRVSHRGGNFYRSPNDRGPDPNDRTTDPE